MSRQHSGSCLCGAVKFSVEGDFEHFYLCHCAYCRKDTGSAHAANLFAPAGVLYWEHGRDKVVEFHLPGTRHRHCICSVCGSALPYRGQQFVVVPAGSLDTPLALRPDAHLFAASRADWDRNLVDVPTCARFPE